MPLSLRMQANIWISDKEAWEPVLQTLLLPQNTSKTLGAEPAQPAVLIREAWSFDAPEHGESADANQEALKYTPNGICTSRTLSL